MGDITFALRGGEAWRSPWADYRRLRDESPVHFVPAAGDNTDFHVLSRFADVFRAVRDTETFSSAQGLTPNADAMTMFDAGQEPIVMMDPPDHTAMRRLVGKQMTPRRVSQIEGAVGAFVDARLDRVADAGGSPVDIVEVLFKPLPSFIVAHYLGVPTETRANFDEWTNAIVAANAEGSFESAMDATMALLGFAGELIERKKVEPGEDLGVGAVGEAMVGDVGLPGLVGLFGCEPDVGGPRLLLRRRLDQGVAFEDPVDRCPRHGGLVMVFEVPGDRVGAGVETFGGELSAELDDAFNGVRWCCARVRVTAT